ncbi:MAG: family 10 glycosylhydrolase [Planctomycetes bacterium]|nr:family 10 glycosylhydrolase [Planctomycetota bacterium]
MQTRLLLPLACLAAAALAAALPAQELRGTWIARDGLTSRAKIVSSLDAARAANLNVVCVNVWSRGYTLHPSAVLGRVAGVAQDPTFAGRDPLDEMIVEAHRRGLEVEAWLEYGFCAGWNGWYPGTAGRGPVLNARPDWTAVDVNGNTSVTDANGTFYWLAHEHPEVRAFLIDLAVELIDRYDLDGVQLDRIRYPSTAFGYDAATVAAYRATHNGSSPPTNPDQSGWKRWRADRLTAFTADAYAALHARRPTVRVTNAPVVMTTSYDLYLQDWPAWVAAGSLDLVYPQVYRTTLADYTRDLDSNLARVPAAMRDRVVPGVRAITGTPTSEVLAMVAANRQRNLRGQVFWYLEGLYDDLPALVQGPFASPAAVPGRPPLWRPSPIVIEEGLPGSTVTGPWTVRSDPSASGGSRLETTAGTGAAVDYAFLPSGPGLHALQVHRSVLVGGHPAAPVHVQHAGGWSTLRTAPVTSTSAGFVSLGTFWLDRAIAPSVVRIDGAGLPANALVAADAVQWLTSRQAGGPLAAFGQGSGPTVPGLGVGGTCTPGGRLDARIQGVAPGGPAVLALGIGRAVLPIPGGPTLWTVPIATFTMAASPYGEAAMLLDLPHEPGAIGIELVLQAVTVQSGALAASAAVAATVR